MAMLPPTICTTSIITAFTMVQFLILMNTERYIEPNVYHHCCLEPLEFRSGSGAEVPKGPGQPRWKFRDSDVLSGVVQIGLDGSVDDLSSVDSKRLGDETCKMPTHTDRRSTHVAGGAYVDKDRIDADAGDYDIMCGYVNHGHVSVTTPGTAAPQAGVTANGIIDGASSSLVLRCLRQLFTRSRGMQGIVWIPLAVAPQDAMRMSQWISAMQMPQWMDVVQMPQWMETMQIPQWMETTQMSQWMDVMRMLRWMDATQVPQWMESTAHCATKNQFVQSDIYLGSYFGRALKFVIETECAVLIDVDSEPTLLADQLCEAECMTKCQFMHWTRDGRVEFEFCVDQITVDMSPGVEITEEEVVSDFGNGRKHWNGEVDSNARRGNLSQMAVVKETFEASQIHRDCLQLKMLPACFNDAQRRLTENALVCDLGDGALDMSLLTADDGILEVAAVIGDAHLGSENFEQRVTQHFARTFHNGPGTDMIEDLREELEEALRTARQAVTPYGAQIFQGGPTREIEIACPRIQEDVNALMGGMDGAAHLVVPTQRCFESCEKGETNNDCFKDVLGPVRQVLEDSGSERNRADEIVLAGDSIFTPRTQQLVKDFLNGEELDRSIHPDETVACDPVVQVGILNGQGDQELLPIDVTPLTLSIETASGVMMELISYDTVILIKGPQILSVYQHNQPAVNVWIDEGERPMTKDDYPLSKFELGGIPSAPHGQPQVQMTFETDSAGILDVGVKDKGTGRNEEITITNDGDDLTRGRNEKMTEEAEQLTHMDKKVKERVPAKSAFDDFSLEEGEEDFGVTQCDPSLGSGVVAQGSYADVDPGGIETSQRPTRNALQSASILREEVEETVDEVSLMVTRPRSPLEAQVEEPCYEDAELVEVDDLEGPCRDRPDRPTPFSIWPCSSLASSSSPSLSSLASSSLSILFCGEFQSMQPQPKPRPRPQPKSRPKTEGRVELQPQSGVAEDIAADTVDIHNPFGVDYDTDDVCDEFDDAVMIQIDEKYVHSWEDSLDVVAGQSHANPPQQLTRAVGRSTSAGMDGENGASPVVLICGGCALSHDVSSLDLVKHGLTEYFMRILIECDHSFTAVVQHETVNDVKEKLCCIPMDFDIKIKRISESSDEEKIFEHECISRSQERFVEEMVEGSLGSLGSGAVARGSCADVDPSLPIIEEYFGSWILGELGWKTEELEYNFTGHESKTQNTLGDDDCDEPGAVAVCDCGNGFRGLENGVVQSPHEKDFLESMFMTRCRWYLRVVGEAKSTWEIDADRSRCYDEVEDGEVDGHLYKVPCERSRPSREERSLGALPERDAGDDPFGDGAKTGSEAFSICRPCCHVETPRKAVDFMVDGVAMGSWKRLAVDPDQSDAETTGDRLVLSPGVSEEAVQVCDQELCHRVYDCKENALCDRELCRRVCREVDCGDDCGCDCKCGCEAHREFVGMHVPSVGELVPHREAVRIAVSPSSANDPNPWMLCGIVTGALARSQQQQAEQVQRREEMYRSTQSTQSKEEEFVRRWNLDWKAKQKLLTIPSFTRDVIMHMFRPNPTVSSAEYSKVFMGFVKNFSPDQTKLRVEKRNGKDVTDETSTPRGGKGMPLVTNVGSGIVVQKKRKIDNEYLEDASGDVLARGNDADSGPHTCSYADAGSRIGFRGVSWSREEESASEHPDRQSWGQRCWKEEDDWMQKDCWWIRKGKIGKEVWEDSTETAWFTSSSSWTTSSSLSASTWRMWWNTQDNKEENGDQQTWCDSTWNSWRQDDQDWWNEPETDVRKAEEEDSYDGWWRNDGQSKQWWRSKDLEFDESWKQDEAETETWRAEEESDKRDGWWRNTGERKWWWWNEIETEADVEYAEVRESEEMSSEDSSSESSTSDEEIMREESGLRVQEATVDGLGASFDKAEKFLLALDLIAERRESQRRRIEQGTGIVVLRPDSSSSELGPPAPTYRPLPESTPMTPPSILKRSSRPRAAIDAGTRKVVIQARPATTEVVSYKASDLWCSAEDLQIVWCRSCLKRVPQVTVNSISGEKSRNFISVDPHAETVWCLSCHRFRAT